MQNGRLVLHVCIIFIFALSSCTERAGTSEEQLRSAPALTREQVLNAPEKFITVGSDRCDFRTLREAVSHAGPEKSEIVLMDTLHTEGGLMIDRDLILYGLRDEKTVLQAAAESEEARDRVLQIEEGATVRITDLTIRHGNAPGPYRSGGGIRNYGVLTLEYCTIRDNRAVYGAGILNDGTLRMDCCTVADNRTLPMTMAERVDATGCTGSGGGVKNQPGALLEMNGCTISGNFSLKKGGGLFVSCESESKLINCTISGNESRQSGGGIHIRGDLEMVHCTVADNSSVRQGGGTYNLGYLDMTGCIIAANTPSDFILGSGGGVYGRGEMGTDEWNLIADGRHESRFNGSPKLGPLTNNGGYTQTHALPRKSPAVDVIPPEEMSVSEDQRGRLRQDRAGDLGAFER